MLHHNVDKALLVAGCSEPKLGGGRVTVPMEVILSGRVTHNHGGVDVPVEEIAKSAVQTWVRDNLRFVDPDQDLRGVCKVHRGADARVGLVEDDVVRCNDTSIGVGYAPLSHLERTVLNVERALNSTATKLVHPEFGEDVKVMGVRTGDHIQLTVAVAMVDRFLNTVADYQASCEAARQIALEVSGAHEVWVNAADDIEAGRLYLTVTGTSAEGGDDGQVGRGNRVNQLITPFRPMSLEAVAGKNPTAHVGKIYNVLARTLSNQIVCELDEVTAATVLLVSRIGQPINEPQLCEVRLSTEGASLDALRRPIERIVRQGLVDIPKMSADILYGRLVITG